MPRSSTDDNDKPNKPLKAILKQALIPNSKPTEATFPELPHVLFWMRGLFGAALGFYLGQQQITGAAVLMHCLNFLSFVPVVYVYLYLGVQTNSMEFGGIWKLLWSGMTPAMALCVLVWVYMFTAMHERQMELLNGILLKNMTAEESSIDSSEASSVGDASEF
jgi:hypothetical protein